MNLWILTEERPKIKVLKLILEKFAKDRNTTCLTEDLRILPILKNNKFTFTYELTGFSCKIIDKIIIKTVSGKSSFLDFLIFYQDNEPISSDKPIYLIEETKTGDKESRNTSVYQRCAKFVFVDLFYSGVPKIMLYNLQTKQKRKSSDTYIFGTRMLLTLGVEILGKELDPNEFKPFLSIDEIITSKNSMRPPPSEDNVPIKIKKLDNRIEISGRLFKPKSKQKEKTIDTSDWLRFDELNNKTPSNDQDNGSLSHDPSIGTLSLICSVIRLLKWSGELVITKHGLKQEHITPGNKFICIANLLDIQLEGLKMADAVFPEKYWHFEYSGEKLGTIFLHIAVESFTKGSLIFENHAGCEKGYFITPSDEHIQLKKYNDREKYKAGDKTQIIHIPDLILFDSNRNEVINCEGKRIEKSQDGIDELTNYYRIEEKYIQVHYQESSITRTVILFGGTAEEPPAQTEIGFVLNKQGDLILGTKAPGLFKDAIKNLLDYWGKNG